MHRYCPPYFHLPIPPAKVTIRILFKSAPAIATILAAPAAFALPAQTNTTQLNSAFSVSGTDLLQTAGPTVSGTGNLAQEGIQGLAALNDGIYGPQGGANANPGLGAFSAGSGETVNISFPQANGVTINTLNSFAAWDAARGSQAFRFEYQSTVQPGVWHRLATVNHNPGIQSGSNTNTQVALSDSTGTLATNVSQIRFVYANTDFWGWNGFREVDATGSLSAAPVGPQFLKSVQINEAYTPSSTDLLQSGGIVTTSSGNFQDETQAGISALTDGSYGIAGNPGAGGGSATGNAGEIITFTLDTVSSPLGYSLSGVDLYAGWDGFRGGQNYTLSYSTVSDPGTFISLGSVDWDTTSNNAPGGTIATRTMVRDAEGELASSVGVLRIAFGDVSFGYAGYREIDVFGTAMVPEPSTATILAMSGLTLLRRRRK